MRVERCDVVSYHGFGIRWEVDGDDVESDGVGLEFVSPDDLGGEGCESALFVVVDAQLGEGVCVLGCLDFDDDDGFAIGCQGDDIDFAEAVSKVACHEAEAFFLKHFCGDAFALIAEGYWALES